MVDIDAGDYYSRKAITTRLLYDEVLQTVVVLFDVGTVSQLSNTHPHVHKQIHNFEQLITKIQFILIIISISYNIISFGELHGGVLSY